MELSKLQQDIINSNAKKSLVISSAASGKTRLLTEKVRKILKEGVNPRDIAVITFTNMAAAELRQRLGADYPKGLFVGTIHALANYFLVSHSIPTGKFLNEDKFDELFKLVEDHPECVRHLQWVLLDEGQDSDELQFKFLFELINPEYFFICADPKQSIYIWKGSNPELINELAMRRDVSVFDMNENYRNGNNILKWAKWLIFPTGQEDTSVAMRENVGKVCEGIDDAATIKGLFSGVIDFVNWAILCRTNVEIEKVTAILKGARIPCETFKQGDLSKEELLTKMQQNTVKVLTVHSAKGLEWDNVIAVGMKYFSNEERNICYVAATRARNKLYWLRPVKTTQKKTKIYTW